jgi:glycosyltransferase involved in cell wall biosynthesis
MDPKSGRPEMSGDPGDRLPLPAGPAPGELAVTVVMVVRDEERNLQACLSRLLWADRILVIDDGSKDGTVDLVRTYTEWVVPGRREPGCDPVHLNLNRGFELVPSGWILQVDADELISPQLAAEVRETVRGNLRAAYRIPFRTALLGRWMKHGYWGAGTRLIRLHRAGAARYPLRAVHETLEVAGPIGEMDRPIFHRPYNTVSEFLKKTDLYTTRESERIVQGTSPGFSGLGKRAAHPSSWTLLGSALRIFLWAQFRRGGWRDGPRGTASSLLAAGYSLLETLKAWERAEQLDQIPPLPEEGRAPL